MFDHLIIRVSDLEVMVPYYERVMATLGYHKGVEYPGGTQFANDEDGDSVWISPGQGGRDRRRRVTMHGAPRAPTR